VITRRNTAAASARRSGPGLQEVVVIAFAANRVARAVSVDSISAPIRQRLRRSPQQASPQEASQASGRARQFTAELLDCPVCTGWWSSLALSMMWPGRYRLRRGLAVAGVQVVLSFAERLVSEEGRIAVHEAQVTGGD
jgi:hypothetical protein